MGLWKQAIVIAVVLGLLSLLILVGVGLPSDNGAEPVNDPPYYISVIEAGLDDSKVHSYKFGQDKDGKLSILDTNFVKVKPGLFAFADTPSETDAGVVSLVAHVDAFVPAIKRPFSPLFLRAPSTIHATPNDDQDESEQEREREDENSSERYLKSPSSGPTPLLLRAARGALFRSGYAVPGLESAAIIRPEQRALYAWYAANYLTGNFKYQNSTEATIDLDWDSLKITYEPNEKDREFLNPKDVYDVPCDGKIMKVFSKSYMNLGLLDLRFSVFETENDMNLTMINSSCVNPEIENEEWIYDNKVYEISGTLPGQLNANGRPSVDFEKCSKLVDEQDLGEPEKRPHQLAGFLAQHKIVIGAPHHKREPEPGEDPNLISGAIYYQRAQTQCSASPGGAEQNGPFSCVDLLLMSRLLEQALGFEQDEIIQVIERIGQNEITWALGFAHSQLTKYIAMTYKY